MVLTGYMGPVEFDLVPELMGRVSERAPAAAGDEVHAKVRRMIAAIVVPVAGKNSAHFRAGFASQHIDFMEVLVIVIQPARFGEADDDFVFAVHVLANEIEIVPLGIIKIVTTPSETAPAEGDKYKLEVFDIDLQRCMFCGLCVEACPYDALFMGSGFEQGQYSRQDMFISIDQLRQAEKHPSTWFRPQLERTGYDPRGGQPLDWKDVGRESWRWHQQEKAGMRLEAPSGGESQSDTKPEPPANIENPGNSENNETGEPTNNESAD